MDEKVKADNIEWLSLAALGKYKREGVAPPDWRQRPHKIGSKLIFPSAGAEWELLQKVRKSVKYTGGGLSTFIYKKVKSTLLDERRDETQGGLKGQHDGINRRPKTGSLTAFDLSPSAADNGQYPLFRYSLDPLIEACRQQERDAYRTASYRDAAEQTGKYSKPTQRSNIRALSGASAAASKRLCPNGVLCRAMICTKLDCRVPALTPGYTLDGPVYWTEPPDGHYLTDWAWKGGRWYKPENGRRRWIKQGHLVQNVTGGIVSADVEFRDMGRQWFEDMVPADRERAAYARRKTWGAPVPTAERWTDRRERPDMSVGTLRLNRDDVLWLSGSLDPKLLASDVRSALCAAWEPASDFEVPACQDVVPMVLGVSATGPRGVVIAEATGKAEFQTSRVPGPKRGEWTLGLLPI